MSFLTAVVLSVALNAPVEISNEAQIVISPVGHHIGVMNKWRAARGLYPLIEDPELVKVAIVRLQDNMRRGKADHNLVNGKWVRPLPSGCIEGCGNTFSTERCCVCDSETVRYTHVGFVMARMPNGRIWQMAVYL